MSGQHRLSYAADAHGIDIAVIRIRINQESMRMV